MSRWPDDSEDGGEAPRGLRERAALRELESVYREADALVARQSCPRSSECCHLAHTGREPYLLPLERLRIDRALRLAGRTWPEARGDGACAFLAADGLGCAVYPDRPFGCRTFFCARAQGKAPATTALHALSARLTASSDALEPGGEPVAITRLFRAG